jgi:hypothetical protein
VTFPPIHRLPDQRCCARSPIQESASIAALVLLVAAQPRSNATYLIGPDAQGTVNTADHRLKVASELPAGAKAK